MATFGKRLRELRNSKNLTQKELGKLFKISESAVGMYERDEREPSFELTKMIANFFQVSTDYLLGRTMELNLTVEVAGQEIKLSAEEYKVFEEIKKHPIMFHDLATDPEKKVRQLIKMWEFIKKDLEEDDDDRDDIIED